MFRWLLNEVIVELRRTEKRIMAKMDELKSAEDREGAAILRAVSQNTENLAKIKELLDSGASPEDLQALVDEANAHAQQLEDAFPAPADTQPGGAGSDTTAGGQS